MRDLGAMPLSSHCIRRCRNAITAYEIAFEELQRVTRPLRVRKNRELESCALHQRGAQHLTVELETLARAKVLRRL